MHGKKRGQAPVLRHGSELHRCLPEGTWVLVPQPGERSRDPRPAPDCSSTTHTRKFGVKGRRRSGGRSQTWLSPPPHSSLEEPSAGLGPLRADGLRLQTGGLELWLVVVAFNPVQAAGMQLGAPGGEEQFHVQLELQRERGGKRDLITSAGPGPRPPRFKHLSVARDAGGVLIGIICQPFGASWCVVHAASPVRWAGGILGSFEAFLESR